MSEDVEWGVEGELVEVFVGVEEAEMWLEESLPGLEVVVVESSAGEGGDFAEVLGAEGGDGEEGAGVEGVGEALKESWEVADPLEDGVGEEEVEVCGEGEGLEVSGDEGGAWAVLVEAGAVGDEVDEDELLVVEMLFDEVGEESGAAAGLGDAWEGALSVGDAEEVAEEVVGHGALDGGGVGVGVEAAREALSAITTASKSELLASLFLP